MNDVDTDADDAAASPVTAPAAVLNHPASLLVAVLVGGGLAAGAHASAVALLVAVAVVQAVLAVAWVFGNAQPGRIGALIIAGLASAGADVAVSLYPHGRLGTLLIVFGLAIPVLFIHQLTRGAARARIVDSIGGITLLVVAEVGLTALLQLRHEFSGSSVGGHVVTGTVVAAAGALVIGYLVDLLVAAPRFDPTVPRGLLAVVASAGLGGSLGHLLLHTQAEFTGGRGAFAGAALGALVALLAVGVAFIEVTPGLPSTGFARRLRPVVAAVLPLAVVAPVAYLLCLAVRS